MLRMSIALGLAMVVAGCNGGTSTKGTQVNNDTDTDTTPPAVIETAVPTDGNDDIDNAEDLTDFPIEELTLYEIAADRINPIGDRDFYAVTLEEGKLYQIFTNAWDETTDTVILDTVLRVYDESGTLVTENDDMVYRYRNTDSAVFVSPTATGVYYIEVLEYGDWAESDAQGTFNHEYSLILVNMPFTEREGENDTLEAVLVDPDEPVDTASDELALFITSPVSTYAADFYGRVDTETDVDWWPISIGADEAGNTPEDFSYLCVSMWPDVGETPPKMGLYNAGGELLATTDDPVPGINSLWIDDVGMMSIVNEGETYYVKVEHNGGATGTAGWYPGIRFQYLPGLGTPETEPNDSTTQPNFHPLQESTTTAGFYSGAIVGALPPSDTADVTVLNESDVGSFDGLYLSVVVRATDLGSALDPKLEIVRVDGDTETVLGQTSTDAALDDHPDPVIRDLLIEGGGNIYLRVTADANDDSGNAELAHRYFVAVYLYTEEIFGQ